jgi:hypothetical protein
MGLMLLVLSPVPYVDASASAAFPNKWQRAIVGGAGMVVELFMAAVALYVWVSVGPGTVRTLAYNTILIAGISTVVFNANPLLRFDGYYILADVLEIPNLRQRANNYLGYLCERYLFGSAEAQAPHASAGERMWFVSYAVSSFVYRVLVVVAILLYLTDQLFVLGVAFAGMTILTWFALPLGKGLKYVFTSPRIRRVRARAVAVSTATAAMAAVLLALLPAPFRTRAEGVVWIPDEAFVRGEVDGFIEHVVAKPGSTVEPGDPLMVCRDPEITKEVKVLQAQLQEVHARIREQTVADLVKAKMLEEEQRYIEERLARAREREADLVILSKTHGTRVDLDEAMAHSNTEYFQRAGERAGAERFMATARALGLGSPTGVNLPGEYAGHLPDGVPARLFGGGEGMEVTPMQLAVLVSAIANGGTRVTPYFARDGAGPSAGVPVGIPARHLERLVPGMIGTVQYGTGKGAELRGVTIAGKTGSALEPDGDLGLFVSYAPVDAPLFAVVVVLHGKGENGASAAAVAGQIYNTLVEKFC